MSNDGTKDNVKKLITVKCELSMKWPNNGWLVKVEYLERHHYFLNAFSEDAEAVQLFNKRFSEIRDFFSSGQIQTMDGWVGSVNSTSVLFRPHIQKNR